MNLQLISNYCWYNWSKEILQRAAQTFADASLKNVRVLVVFPWHKTFVFQFCLFMSTRNSVQIKRQGLCASLILRIETLASETWHGICYFTSVYVVDRLVVSSVLRYLSSSAHGLTECELLDALSCNNEACEAALQATLNDNERKLRLLRFPYSIWYNVRVELGTWGSVDSVASLFSWAINLYNASYRGFSCIFRTSCSYVTFKTFSFSQMPQLKAILPKVGKTCVSSGR